MNKRLFPLEGPFVFIHQANHLSVTMPNRAGVLRYIAAGCRAPMMQITGVR
jgi:hypothetical protein